jgi:hypothetical protein
MTPVDVAWYSSKSEAVIYDRRSAFIETVNLIICAFFAVDIAVCSMHSTVSLQCTCLSADE